MTDCEALGHPIIDGACPCRARSRGVPRPPVVRRPRRYPRVDFHNDPTIWADTDPRTAANARRRFGR